MSKKQSVVEEMREIMERRLKMAVREGICLDGEDIPILQEQIIRLAEIIDGMEKKK